MEVIILITAGIAIWYALNKWILPKVGIPT